MKVSKKDIAQKSISTLCKKDDTGVIKSNITVENYDKLRELIDELDIKSLKNSHNLSYRQYCKIFESHVFRTDNKCDGEICCQALTENGKRCKRASNKFTTIDVTEKHLTPTIPQFIKNKIGVKKVEELKLIGFANSCCFYCWQHAAMFVSEKSTWATNFAYYSTHPEDIISIFFDDVKPTKFFGTITYNVNSLGKLRSPDEIVKYMYKTYAATKGVTSGVYWGIFVMVYMYDTMKPILSSFISGSKEQKEEFVETIAVGAANSLIIINK